MDRHSISAPSHILLCSVRGDRSPSELLSSCSPDTQLSSFLAVALWAKTFTCLGHASAAMWIFALLRANAACPLSLFLPPHLPVAAMATGEDIRPRPGQSNNCPGDSHQCWNTTWLHLARTLLLVLVGMPASCLSALAMFVWCELGLLMVILSTITSRTDVANIQRGAERRDETPWGLTGVLDSIPLQDDESLRVMRFSATLRSQLGES